MVDEFQEAALDTRLGIPLLYGVDSVHGHGNLLGATVFPHNIGLGATRDPRLLQQIGHITAKETRASGPNWSFAPCVCVAREDRWGRTYESFGETPRLVKQLETVIDGLQGTPGPARPARPGARHRQALRRRRAHDVRHRAEGDYTVDQGITRGHASRVRRRSRCRRTRRRSNEHHVGSVMPSFSSVDFTDDEVGNPVKMHASKELITDVLKDEHGLRGHRDLRLAGDPPDPG